MVNYRVDESASLLQSLRDEECEVLGNTDDSGFGRFGWAGATMEWSRMRDRCRPRQVRCMRSGSEPAAVDVTALKPSS